MTDAVDHREAFGLDALRDEMRCRFAPVPGSIEGVIYADDFLSLSRNEFLFSTGNVRFPYRVGHGVTACFSADAENVEDEFRLYLRGTVFGAVAWLNGLVPLHASAVAASGRVIAFTADSGGGKSTLAAALAGRRGFCHVCDDTLVLDPAPGQVMALPDGKPLKLWEDAFALTGARQRQAIGLVPGKHYAEAVARTDEILPLTDLVFLEWGARVALEPVTGSAKLPGLRDALYRGFIHAARADGAGHAAMMMAIAGPVRFWRLTRPCDRTGFQAQLRDVERLVRGLAPALP